MTTVDWCMLEQLFGSSNLLGLGRVHLCLEIQGGPDGLGIGPFSSVASMDLHIE